MVNNLTTNENGTCTITGVSKGSLTITVSKEGYVDATETINVTKNETINIVLEEETEETPVTSRLVSFSVNDGAEPTPNGIGDVTIVIDDGISKTTGGAGGCTQELTDGEHTIVISKEGYETKTETITVSEENDSFTISLVESI